MCNTTEHPNQHAAAAPCITCLRQGSCPSRSSAIATALRVDGKQADGTAAGSRRTEREEVWA